MPWEGLPEALLPEWDVARDIGERAQQVLVEIGLEVREALRAGSPVRTGALRASWSLSHGVGFVEIRPGVPYSSRVRIDVTEADAAVFRGQRRISRVVADVLGR